VDDRNISCVENPGDEKEAVAVGRILLAAHHRDSILPRPVEQPVQTSLELLRVGHPPVEHMTVEIVELVTVGSAPKLLPKEHVLQALFFESKLEISAIELRVEPRERCSTYIDDDLDVVQFQQADERGQRLR
jgi:hypothetical protein